MYIAAASTISHQPAFRNKGFSTQLAELIPPSAIRHPDYAALIPAMNRRRMSDVLTMAIACTVDCLEQSGLEQPDAIIVGTSMGCNTFTKNFLDKIIAAGSGPLSPTAFILSTHNTIAGQISLHLGNQQYNMTHTHNSLSFEQALLDAVLCLENGAAQVLVGAADEAENALYNIHARLQRPELHATYGASFFILTAEKTNPGAVHLVDTNSWGLLADVPAALVAFLESNALSATEVDLVLYSGTSPAIVTDLNTLFGRNKLVDYQKLSGVYYTNPAFALHYGVDILSQPKHPVFGESIRRILICNNLIPENLGLTLIDV